MKNLLAILLLALSINSLPQIPTSGLIGYWPFNGNANDESGNGNDGIVHGAALTQGREGILNSAYLFDGYSNYIELPPSIALNTDSSFSIEAWINNDTITSDGKYTDNAVFGQTDGLYGSDLPIILFEIRVDNTVRGAIRGIDYPALDVRSQVKIEDDKWYNIVMVRNAQEDNLAIYVNGCLYSIGEDHLVGNTISNDFVSIGAFIDDLQALYHFFCGKIDDVRIYNRALSPKEILSLFSQGNTDYYISGESEVCQGQKNVGFYVQPIYCATTYIWNYSGKGAIISGSSNSLLIDFANDATSGDLSVTARNNNIDIQSLSISIEVNPLPLIAGTISGDNEVCTGQIGAAYIVQPIDNATSYVWNYSGTGASITGSSNSISIDFADNAISGSLIVAGNNSCGNGPPSEIFPIYVEKLPLDPGIITGESEICQNQNNVTYVIPVIENVTSYLWNYSGNGAAITGSSNTIEIDFSKDATSGNLTVVGNNICGNGPVSEDFSIDVISCDSTPPAGIINIPNSFSPNGDGVNDLFIIRGLSENSRVMIFDRSGKKLYESDNYQNDWDGRDNDGKALETDTYWYVIHISGIPSFFKGFVYLKR